MPTINIEGLTLLAEAAPSTGRSVARPPILFVHGYLATASVWERYLDFFSLVGYPCYALNLRGRAGSRPTDALGAIRLQEFVDDARDAARALGAPIVIGHSMGGLIAQKLAEEGAARAAVLVASAPPRGIFLVSWPLTRHLLPYVPAIFRSRPVTASFEDLRDLVLNRIPPAEQREVFSRFVPDSGRAARDMMLGSVSVDARRVACPMLVVGGDNDRFMPWRIGEAIAAKYGARRLMAHGHGHALIQEPGWERIAADIAQWLDATASSWPAEADRGIA